MSLKDYITTSYGNEISLDTKTFQQEKIQNAKAENQMILLYKYMSNNVTWKSLRLRVPIKTTKCRNIMKERKRKLFTQAWNEAKKTPWKWDTFKSSTQFVWHFVKSCLQKIMKTLCKLLMQQKKAEYQSLCYLKEKLQQLKAEKQKR